MATALLAFATGGCVDPLDDSLKPQPEEPTLTFWIRVPGSMLTTKALTGDVDGIQYESTLHDVQVWVFPHVSDDAAATTLPLNYVEKNLDVIDPDEWDTHTTTNEDWLPDNDPKNPVHLNSRWGKAYKIQMPMPKEFVLGSDPRVDIYILANNKSIFNSFPSQQPSQMTLVNVRDLVFSSETSSNFGTGTNPTTSVPDEGLPISTVYKGADGNGVSLQFLQDAYNGTGDPLTNDLFKEKLGVIELERAVAKIRFAFSRPSGIEGVQITKIEIFNTATAAQEGLIPDKTFAFPRYALPRAEHPFALPTGASYGAATTTTTLGKINDDDDPLFVYSQIGECADPSTLTMEWFETNTPVGYAQTAQGYEEYLSDAINYKEGEVAKPKATEIITYFRESDKPITGTISYRLPGMKSTDPDKTAPFDMTTVEDYSASTTNLHRNHYWTVYAYFRGGDLRIKPVLVQDWVYDDTKQYYEYKQMGEAHIVFSDKSQSLFGYGYTTSIDNTWNYVDYTGVVTEYSCSVNSSFGSWSTTSPTDFTTNKYFWVRTGITLSDGRTLYSPVVAKGPKKVTTGNTTTTYNVTGISVQYAISSSDSVSPTNGWSSDSQDWDVNNPFVWVKVTTTYSDNSSVDNIVCVCNKNDLYKSPTTTEWYFRRQDWNSEGHEHDVAQPVSAEAYPWKDWVHSQIVVAPGLNAANVPAYSNRIELVTSYFKVPLYLKLTNPTNFSIVLYHSESNSYEVFSDASGAVIPENYYVEGEVTKHRAIRSYFYVVPKDAATPPGSTTGVYLVTGTDTNNPNPMKLPFNSDAFPGSQDYTEVYFYCVDEATFQDYYTTQPVNIKAYGKTGEVTI